MVEEKDNKLKKVVSGTVTTKKKSEFRKIAEQFLSEDIIDIRSHVVHDIIIPAIKRIISEAVNLALYNDGYSADSERSSYRSYGSVSRSDRRRSSESRFRSDFGLDDIVLSSRADADDVLEGLHERIHRYGYASVVDLYDLLGKVCPYTYENYGWTDIRTAKVVLARDGYLLRLPRPMPID